MAANYQGGASGAASGAAAGTAILPGWGTAIGAGLGGIGGLMNSGSNNEHIGSDELYPDWYKGNIQGLMNNIPQLQTPEYYQGQLVADQSQNTQNSLAGMGNFGQPGGAGYDAMNNVMGAGNQALGAIGQGMDFQQNLANRGPNQFQYDQGTYDQSFNNLSGGLQNAFDLNSQQIQQNFDWNMLPGLNMAGALGGQNGATKQYQQGALGQGLADINKRQFGSDLYMNAANQSNQMGYNAGSQNLGSANAFDNNMMSQYGQMGQLGANLTGQGYDMGVGNLGLQNQAGRQQDTYAQDLINADQNKWNFEQNAPWLDQEARQGLTQSWHDGNAFQYGNSPFQNALAVGQTVAGVASGGADAGWWGNDPAATCE